VTGRTLGVLETLHLAKWLAVSWSWLMCQTLGPQLVALFWEVEGTLKGRA
jgi:hypothetical protein